ncbi:MAG: translation initiation factor 2 [Oscillospiraceae bacterium]|nr:translation initiation factor 2 [Oscillospiraceae bacterium]
MVKGVSRRVIVVQSPDRRLFEQAIFIMREDAFTTEGVTADQVIEEARRVANGYVRTHSGWGKRVRKLTPSIFMALGAGFMGLVWFLFTLL